MKKCPGCEREIDKHGIACEYCGKLDDLEAQSSSDQTQKSVSEKSND